MNKKLSRTSLMSTQNARNATLSLPTVVKIYTLHVLSLANCSGSPPLTLSVKQFKQPKSFDEASLVSPGFLFTNQTYLAQFGSVSYKVMAQQNQVLCIFTFFIHV